MRVQREELAEELAAVTRQVNELKRQLAAVPPRDASPPAHDPGRGAADIVRLRQQIAQVRGKAGDAEKALRAELAGRQTSLAAEVEKGVDDYFAESAKLRRALHEQQQPHASNTPAAELRKLREQERQLRGEVAQARWEHDEIARELAQADRDASALAAELRRADASGAA